MGAYNDWKWSSFDINSNKSHLNGDWWSCQVHVPEEAYRIDFVFQNGSDVYDNNAEKDFHITVEEGWMRLILKISCLKKRLEQEEFARQKADREKEEEEKRLEEADIAAKEDDRAQAREEVAKSMGALKELMKMGVSSVNNVWYIEPSEFEGGDKVRLYYNKSSGPLFEATEIWIHGGHNGWKDGLSIFSKLVKFKNKDGDWWYTDGSFGCMLNGFVFSEGKDGGVFDNKNGVDYYIPVLGGFVKEPPMHIVHIAVEMASIAKEKCCVKEDTGKLHMIEKR